MVPTSTSGFIAGKPIKLEVAQKGRDYAQTKAHSRLSDECIRKEAKICLFLVRGFELTGVHTYLG